MKRALMTWVLFAYATLAAVPADAQWFGWRGWGYGAWGGCGPVWGGPVWGGPMWGGPVWGGPVFCGPGCGCAGCCGAPACWGGVAWSGNGPYGVGLGAYPYRPFVNPGFPDGFASVPPAVASLPSRPLDGAPASALRFTSVAAAATPPVSDLDRVLGRVAGIESRRKAERMLTEGDDLFRAQNFHSALQRYKLAASTAPEFAEAFWRKGHALVATRNYELAVAAFRRAIELGGDVNRDGFRLDDIYGPARMTKSIQLDALAEWALAHTDASEAWFLVGITLYYDGQQPRAEKFLARAQALSGMEDLHVAAFSRRVTVATTKSPVVPAMTFGRDT